MSDIKLVVFDLDGTLVDAFDAVTKSVNYSLEQAGFDVLDHETIKKKVGWGETSLIRSLVAPEEVDKILSIYRIHHKTALKSATRLLPGVKVLLDELKLQGFKLAIATNRPMRFAHIILKHLKIRDYFHYILCGDMVKNPKPAGDMLEDILAKFDLRAHQALYVGDMTIDIETGHAANVKTVAVMTGTHTREEIEPCEPFKIVENIADVLKFI